MEVTDLARMTGELEEIGVVASGSRENESLVILYEGMEKLVTNETLVLIDNRNGNKVLAICRGGFGVNDALRAVNYTPGVAYARRGGTASTAKEFYAFRLVVIGDVTSGKIHQNMTIVAPGSKVYRFNVRTNPMEFLSTSTQRVGYYATGFKTWEVPVQAEYISSHIGIFGVTGSGKSYLCRHQVIPLLMRNGYDVLILDWKGSDYAPYYSDRVINMGDVELDDASVKDYLASALNEFGGGDTGSRLVNYLDEVIATTNWRGIDELETKSNLLRNLESVIRADNTDQYGRLSRWGEIYLRKVKRVFDKLDAAELRPVMGTKRPDEIIRELREKHLLVLDLSYGAKEQKLSMFLSIARYLKRLMEEKQELRIALVIDEAPQYCPWQPKGLEERTTKMLTELAALGRSYRLALTLISQGIAGEIGINAAVRRNLNTLFIGRIHPLDALEAEKFFATSLVQSDQLLRLPEGYFFLIGKLNPSPVPLLITFEIPEEERRGGR
ncbi:MAG: DUF87 domain-containing protein [Thaumarchaeota archaeon]|nr:DUF87 domain-containing protein [Candidatus Calditenuaceae archaeon]MDW8041677.1 DUF87 domain-containing protein [Nitrososphaerota archaeon]